MKKFAFLFLLSLSIFGLNSVAQEKQSAKQPKPIDYENQVLPILEDNCTACHNSVVTKNKLDLEEIAGMIKGGKRGTALVPGKPEKSLLYLVAARKKKPHMPPLPNVVDAKKITPKELKILERWIREGAKDSPAKPETTVKMSPLASRLNPIYSLAVSPYGRTAAVGRGSRIHIIDLLTQQAVENLSDPQLRNISSNGNERSFAHLDFVHALAFSPNGKILASAGYRTVKLWKKMPAQFQAKVKSMGSFVAHTFDSQSTRLATVSKDGSIKIVEIATGKILHQFQKQNVAINLVSWSPDENHLLIVTNKTTLELLDVTNGKLIASHRLASEVRDLIVLGKDKLVLGCADGTIRIGNTIDLLKNIPAKISKQKTKQKKTKKKLAKPQKKKPLFVELKGHTKPVTALALLPDGRILSASEDATISIWYATKQLKSIAHGVPIVKLTVSPDGKLIATTSNDHTVRVWDLGSGKQISSWKMSPGDTFRLAQSTNEAEYARLRARLANSDLTKAKKGITARELEVKKAKDAKQKADKARADAETKFKTADENLKKSQLASKKKPKDNKLKQKLTNTQKAQVAAKTVRDRAGKAAKNAAQSTAIADRGLKQAKAILKTAEVTKKQADEIQKKRSSELDQTKKQLEANKFVVEDLCFDFDNRTLLLATKAGILHRFHAPDGTPLGQIGKPNLGEVRFLARSANEMHYGLSTGEVGALIRSSRWSFISQLGIATQGSPDLSASPFMNRVLALDFSADGKYLATGGGDPSREGELLIWDVEKKTVVRRFEDAHSDTIQAVKFSRDGKFLLTGSADKFAKIFDVASGKLVRSFEGHAHHVMGVAWKADQSQIATAGADNVIKIWDSRTGDQRRTIAGYAKQVSSVEFLGFGINVLSCGGDASVRFHKTNNGQNYRRFNGATNFMHVSRGVRTVKNALEKKEPSSVLSGGETGILYWWNAANGQLIKSFDFKKNVPRATVSR